MQDLASQQWQCTGIIQVPKKNQEQTLSRQIKQTTAAGIYDVGRLCLSDFIWFGQVMIFTHVLLTA